MSITVAELIENLQKLPQGHVVILSKDEEGNGFHTLSELTEEQVEAPDSYYIDLYDDPEKPNAVVLWP